MFESLEKRQLLSGGFFSPLYIYGTNAADTIALSQSGYALTVVQNGVSSVHTTYFTTPGSGVPCGISKVVIYGYDGDDTIKADDTVQLPLEIYGGNGNDSLHGGAMGDTIYGGTQAASEWGYDSIDGGSGDDVLTGSWSGAMIWGGAGNDILTASTGSSTLMGGEGNDSLVGQDGYDFLFGEAGNDTLRGGWGSDWLVGGDGNDSLLGGGMADSLWGNDGNDSLNGQGQIDQLNGGPGDDILNGGDNQADDLVGGAGNDTADYSKRTDDLTITLDNLANDGAPGEKDNVHSDIETVLGGSGADNITGSAFSNLLIGNDGNDIIHGGGGNDTVKGGVGNDFLFGDAGNDSILGEGWNDNLYGGAGDDILDGGTGSDILVDIGGGTHDIFVGGDDDSAGQLDSFWLDSDFTETTNASNAEVSAGHMHRIAGFANGVSKELNGQDLPDPGLYQPGADVDYSATYDHAEPHRFDGNPLFFYGDPYLMDVKQGALGDCYFLAGIGAVAKQKPDKIKQSIVDLGDGTYAVQFFNGGSQAFYRVDNELPARSYWYGYPVISGIIYARPGMGNDMWVPIMEKAYALYRGGSYSNIDGGWANEPYDALGLSCSTKDVDDGDALQTIKNALAAGQAVSVDTLWGHFHSGDTIVANHVYSVYSVDLVNNTITVRNPWGTDTDGTFTQGADDGFVTYTFDSFRKCTDDFYIATL